MSITSQSADNSSILSSPTSSSSAMTSLMSLSRTYSCKLHTPRHIRAHIDWTERWLQMWERRRQPLLKVHSTPTEVARKILDEVYKKKIWMQSLTRDNKIINCHPWQGRIFHTTIIPLMNSINNMLRVRAEVMIKLVAKFCSLRCGECSYSCSKNCPNVWLLCKDWCSINQINYIIIWQ